MHSRSSWLRTYREGTPVRYELQPSNKGMKLTKPERNGALQLIPGVRRIPGLATEATRRGRVRKHLASLRERARGCHHQKPRRGLSRAYRCPGAARIELRDSLGDSSCAFDTSSLAVDSSSSVFDDSSWAGVVKLIYGHAVGASLSSEARRRVSRATAALGTLRSRLTRFARCSISCRLQPCSAACDRGPESGITLACCWNGVVEGRG
jgi:hypothetical protein